jgi:putative ABC transport system substrate-binding protein
MDARYSLTRRRFVQRASAAGLGLLTGCGRRPGQEQVPAKVPRIGYVGGAAPGGHNPQALADGLRELGYVEGYNLTVEWRSTEGRRDRVLEVIAELVALNVDAIVVTGATAALAAQNATRTIPIIIVMLSDPQESGFVASLARPGGNITGLGSFALELSGKQLQLLVEVTPSVARVGVLWERRNPSKARQLKELQDAAQVLGIQIESLALEEPHDLDSAVRAGSQARVDAIFTLQSVLTAGQKARIIELVAQAQVPAIYESSEWTEAGGLMFYGPNFPAMHRRAAYYVDKILRGAAPADLPVERPREFDFAINLKTARALGLTIPQHVLLQATEVIQ